MSFTDRYNYHFSMKKPIKISLIVIGILFLIVVVIALIISPVSKRYVEKNGKELIGRTVTMEKLRFNLFTGSLMIVDFDMKEQNDAESFFRFDTLSVKVKLFDFLRHKVTVKKIHLSDAHLNIWQRGSEFNFDDMIKKFSSAEDSVAMPEEESKPWEIGIYDIQLRNGNVLYKDLAVGSDWDMRDLNLVIPGVYFSGKETDVGFDLLFTDGGRLSSQLQYDIEKSAYRIKLDLEKFSVGGLLPYLQQSMRVGSLSGILDAHISITGETEHVMNSAVQGKVELSALDMRDDRQLLVFAADRLTVDMAEVRMEESKYVLNEFSSQGISTMYVMEKDSSSNFTYLMKDSAAPADTVSAKADSAKASPPMRLTIGNVDMKGTKLEFKDNSLQMPFVYELKDIDITAKDFDPDKTNHILIKGKLGATGMTNIRWNGNFNDLSNLNLTIDANSVELKDFTPYSMEYFAYPITSGILTFTGQNIIAANMLNGTNHLDIFKCNVDKASKEVKPVMKVPLRLAVYVLKDRDDKIKLALPVKGDIRSPEFSYRKIILQTLVNVLVKVSLTPLDFVASSLGFDAEQLEKIEFTNLQEDFTSDQYDKFNKLADVLTAKPDLVLEIKQDINYAQAAKDHALYNLKRDYYLTRNSKSATDSLNLIDRAKITEIKDTDPELAKFAEKTLGKEFQGDIYAKATAMYKEAVNEQIAKSTESRNRLLTDYMVTRRGIPATSIKIESVPPAPGKTYNEKSVFRTNLSLPGEEPMQAEPEAEAPASNSAGAS